MDPKSIIDGLLLYLSLVILLTFHEFGHAWMAWKCGDETARSQGRVSLNPLVHIDLIGTVFFPLLAIFLNASGSGLSRFIIGWAKPVPVNFFRLRNPKRDMVPAPSAKARQGVATEEINQVPPARLHLCRGSLAPSVE